MTDGNWYGQMGPPGDGDDWLTRRMMWIAMMIGRVPGPNESIQYGVESQWRVPFVQALTGVLSTVLFIVGLGLLTSQLLWSMGYRVTLGSAVFIGTIGLLLLFAFVFVLNTYLKGSDDKIRFAVSAGGVLLCTAGFLYGLVQFQMRLSGTGFGESVGRSLGVMVGTGLTIYCAALCYRFLSELIDPLYPPPPALRLIDKVLGADMWGRKEDGPAIEQRTPIPVTSQGRRQGQFLPSGEFQAVPKTVKPGEPQGFSVDPETANLIWYVMLAHKIDLSRPAAERLSLYLPFNESGDPQVRRRLNKATHTQLIYRGAELGWWIRRGKGVTAEWNEEKGGKDGVLALALSMWDQLTEGKLPPPDPWALAQYKRGVVYHPPAPPKSEQEGDVPASQVASQPAKSGNWPVFDPDSYTGETD